MFTNIIDIAPESDAQFNKICAGAGFNRAGRFHARAGYNRAGGFRFVTASGFDPPPRIGSPIANVLRNAFLSTGRIHGIANAVSHFIKAFIVAVLVVIAIAVHELDALGNDNFARAGFDRARGFHAGAGFNRT